MILIRPYTPVVNNNSPLKKTYIFIFPALFLLKVKLKFIQKNIAKALEQQIV